MATEAEAFDLLHKKLGNLVYDRLVLWVRDGKVPWTECETPVYKQKKMASPCRVCSMAKGLRPAHRGPILFPQQYGEFFYVDVWGPSDTASLMNEKVYTVGFIEVATKRAWLYHKNSDILECLKHFYKLVIQPRKINRGLKDFCVQSDNGEFCSDGIADYLHSVDGERRTCCAYSPEIMAFIKRLWDIISNMATSLMSENQLPEQYWKSAQNYSLEIYNNIPPTRIPKGQATASPNKQFFGKCEDMSIYKVFGCRAFAPIHKSKQRKNHAAKAVQGIFVGINKSSYPGYLIYGPEYHTIYVTGNATFDQTEKYDGRISNYQAAGTVSKGIEVPVGKLERYKYLERTDQIDPDYDLLYKVTKAEECVYRGQGKFIGAFRAQVLPGGRVSTKFDRDGYQVRDIEKYYNDCKAKVMHNYPAKQAECDKDDDAEDGRADVVAEH